MSDFTWIAAAGLVCLFVGLYASALCGYLRGRVEPGTGEVSGWGTTEKPTPEE